MDCASCSNPSFFSSTHFPMNASRAMLSTRCHCPQSPHTLPCLAELTRGTEAGTEITATSRRAEKPSVLFDCAAVGPPRLVLEVLPCHATSPEVTTA